MRKVKNITVCVTPEIYRQTRHLAAEYDSTVSTIVAWLLQRLPAALERTRFPKGGPKPSTQTTANAAEPAVAPAQEIVPNSGEGKCLIHGCETVTPPLTQSPSDVYSHPSGTVTATVQLYHPAQLQINQSLVQEKANTVQPLQNNRAVPHPSSKCQKISD